MSLHSGESWIGDVGIDPTIHSKANVIRERKVETGIPVDQHKDVHHELGDTKSVGVGSSRLHAIQCLVESRDAE